MTKQEAAEFLGVSPRQIERYTKDNRISVRYEKGHAKPTPVYDEGELQRFKEALEQPTHRPAVHRMEGDSRALATQSDGAMSHLSQLEVLGKLMETITAERPPAAPSIVDLAAKFMLTIDEAVTLSGIGRSAINAAIKSGDLKAHHGLGRGRRLKRSDLEKWAAKL